MTRKLHSALLIATLLFAYAAVQAQDTEQIFGSWTLRCSATASAGETQREEMGRFLLGSTVVMLFPAGPLRFNPAWAPGGAIRLGEAMAS